MYDDFKMLLKSGIKDIALVDYQCAERLAKLYKPIDVDGLNCISYQKINNNLSYFSVKYPNKNTENIVKLQQIILKKYKQLTML